MTSPGEEVRKRRTLEEKMAESGPRISLSEKYDRNRAEAYWAKMVGWCESYGVYECPLVGWIWDLKRYGSPMWVTRRGRPSSGYVASGMERGQVRFAPKGITRTRFLAVDVDVHGKPPLAVTTVLGDMLDREVPTRRGMARRRNVQIMDWRADVALPVLRRLRDSGLFTLVERTPRGWHFVVLLDQALPVRDAARLAARLESLFRTNLEGVKVEAFPKLRADGMGDHCAVPLVGASRRVGPDFVRPAEKKRSVAIDELLADPGRGVVDWVEALTRLDGGVAIGLAPSPVGPANSSSRDPEGQLFGKDFVLRVLEYLTRGIGAGESYDATRKVVAAMRYCGYDEDAVIRMVRTWIRRPGHGARHCLDPGGLRALEKTAEGCLRHFRNGLKAGRCWLNGLRSRELRAALEDLRFEAVGPAMVAA